MLKIRLQRVGRKHEPAFRLVLTDSQNSTKSGRFKEILGSYDPRKDTDVLNADRIKYWLSQGAQPTDTVHNLLITHGVIEGKKRNVLPKKTPPVKEEVKEEAVPVEDSAPATEEKVEEKVDDVPAEAAAPTEEVKSEEPPAEESASVEETPAE